MAHKTASMQPAQFLRPASCITQFLRLAHIRVFFFTIFRQVLSVNFFLGRNEPCSRCAEGIPPRAESGRPKSVGSRRPRGAPCCPPRPARLCPGFPAAKAAPARPRGPFRSRRAVVFFQSEISKTYFFKKKIIFTFFGKSFP